MKSAKKNFYKEKIAELKLKQPGQWYSCLKKITSHAQHQRKNPTVEEIIPLADQEQGEKIAEQFSYIQNEYKPLKKGDISIPNFEEKDVPKLHPSQFWFALSSRVSTNKVTVPGNFPSKLFKHFAAYLADSLTEILNTSIRRGENILQSTNLKFPPLCLKSILHRLYHNSEI